MKKTIEFVDNYWYLQVSRIQHAALCFPYGFPMVYGCVLQVSKTHRTRKHGQLNGKPGRYLILADLIDFSEVNWGRER